MTKFTPGPWTAKDELNDSIGSIFAANHIVVAQAQQTISVHSDPSQAERIANANLIAAAPEMYEALKAIDDSWSNEGWTPENAKARTQFTDDTIERWKLIRAARAKANGGTQ